MYFAPPEEGGHGYTLGRVPINSCACANPTPTPNPNPNPNPNRDHARARPRAPVAPAATIASPDGKRARTRAPTPRRCDFSPKTYSFDDAACPIDAETGRAEASCREEDMELEHFDEGVKHDVSTNPNLNPNPNANPDPNPNPNPNPNPDANPNPNQAARCVRTSSRA